MKAPKHKKVDPRVKREAEARKLGFRNYAELVHEKAVAEAAGRSPISLADYSDWDELYWKH